MHNRAVLSLCSGCIVSHPEVDRVARLTGRKIANSHTMRAEASFGIGEAMA